jgi:hypothetical protein
MIEGLRLFCVGLTEATLERGRLKGQGDADAFRVEIGEIGFFLDELEAKFGKSREMSNHVAGMITGVALFSGGYLQKAIADERAKDNNLEAVAMDCAQEISELLDQLEHKYQELKAKFPPKETMKLSVEWIDSKSSRAN